jgi:hypothetical protein
MVVTPCPKVDRYRCSSWIARRCGEILLGVRGKRERVSVKVLRGMDRGDS